MKVALILSFAVAVMASSGKGCNADNCARQVTGTRPGLTPIESRKDDCSDYMTQTETPEAVTTTKTITVDADEPRRVRRDDFNARAADATTRSVPVYASACNPASRYSSICDCWGITESVTTAPTPTVTKTVTETIDYCEDL